MGEDRSQIRSNSLHDLNACITSPQPTAHHDRGTYCTSIAITAAAVHLQERTASRESFFFA
eukprot:952858-Karenia_brevis.AAC.1